MSEETKEIKPAKGKKPFLLSITLLLSVIAIIISLATWEQSHKAFKKAGKTHNAAFAALNRTVNQQQATIIQNTDNLATYQQTLQKLINKKSSSDEKWNISEAIYLINLAKYSLNYENNPKKAIRILTAAKTQLHKANSADYKKAIQAINKDLTSIEKVKNPHINQLYLKLNGYIRGLPQLPLFSAAHIKVKKHEMVKKNVKAKTWSDSLQNSWQELKSLVNVRHGNGAASVVNLSAQQSLYLYIYLHSMLAQTQFALLHRNNTIYHANVKIMIYWLNTYFLAGSPKVQDFLSALKKMQKINLNPKMPQLTNSMNALLKLQQQEITKK